jgi:hypothetical protein
VTETRVVERNAAGHWVAGQSGNPEGGRVVVGRRRVAIAVEEILATLEKGQDSDEVPECIQTIAENFVRGLKNPDAHPVAARIAWERWWPTQARGAHDDADPTPPESSASQWEAIAEKAEAEVLGEVVELNVVDGGQGDGDE